MPWKQKILMSYSASRDVFAIFVRNKTENWIHLRMKDNTGNTKTNVMVEITKGSSSYVWIWN